MIGLLLISIVREGSSLPVLEPLIEHEQAKPPPNQALDPVDNELRLLFSASSRRILPPTTTTQDAFPSGNAWDRRATSGFAQTLIQTGSTGGSGHRDNMVLLGVLVGVAVLSLSGIVFGFLQWKRPFHTWPGVANEVKETRRGPRDRLLTFDFNMGGAPAALDGEADDELRQETSFVDEAFGVGAAAEKAGAEKAGADKAGADKAAAEKKVPPARSLGHEASMRAIRKESLFRHKANAVVSAPIKCSKCDNSMVPVPQDILAQYGDIEGTCDGCSRVHPLAEFAADGMVICASEATCDYALCAACALQLKFS